jgi:hypothetical protein
MHEKQENSGKLEQPYLCWLQAKRLIQCIPELRVNVIAAGLATISLSPSGFLPTNLLLWTPGQFIEVARGLTAW